MAKNGGGAATMEPPAKAKTRAKAKAAAKAIGARSDNPAGDLLAGLMGALDQSAAWDGAHEKARNLRESFRRVLAKYTIRRARSGP